MRSCSAASGTCRRTARCSRGSPLPRTSASPSAPRSHATTSCYELFPELARAARSAPAHSPADSSRWSHGQGAAQQQRTAARRRTDEGARAHHRRARWQTPSARRVADGPILLVEQNLAVVRQLADGSSSSARRPGRARRRAPRLPLRRRHPFTPAARREQGHGMSTIVLLPITGLGLGALYFLVASRIVADLRPDGSAELRPRRLSHPGRLRRLGMAAARRGQLDHLILGAHSASCAGAFAAATEFSSSASSTAAHRAGAGHRGPRPGHGRPVRRNLGNRPGVRRWTGVADRHDAVLGASIPNDRFLTIIFAAVACWSGSSCSCATPGTA